MSSTENNSRQNHTLSLTAVLEVASNISDTTQTGFAHRTSMVGITCNGANRSFPKEYMIKAIGYGGVEDTLQPNSLYFLKGRFIPVNKPQEPTNGAPTEKHEFFYEANNRLLVGNTETFTSNLHDTVGVTGFGIILSKSTIYEDSVQPKAVREGKVERKPTYVFIVKHRDYHPISRVPDDFTAKYLLRPYPHIVKIAQWLHPGREVVINGFMIDYDPVRDEYVIDVKGATVASGHEDIIKNPAAVPSGVTPAAGRVKPPKFSKEPIVISSDSSLTALPKSLSSGSSIEIQSPAAISGAIEEGGSDMLFPPADLSASSFAESSTAVPAKRPLGLTKGKAPAKISAKTAGKKTVAKPAAKKKGKTA